MGNVHIILKFNQRDVGDFKLFCYYSNGVILVITSLCFFVMTDINN